MAFGVRRQQKLEEIRLLYAFSIPISHGNYSPLEFLFCAAYGAMVFGIPAGFMAWIRLGVFYILFVKKPLGENDKTQHGD